MKYALSTALLLTALRTSSAFLPAGVKPATSATSRLFLFDKLFGTTTSPLFGKYPVYAEEEVMSPKAHGTSEKPVQKKLRWGCDYDTADRSKYLYSSSCSTLLWCVLCGRVASLQ